MIAILAGQARAICDHECVTAGQNIARAALATAGIAAGCVAYAAAYEVRAFRLRRFTVPVLESGSKPLKVLHISDLHMTPRQRRKQAWMRSLAELEPDLVVNTGDNISHRDAVPAVLDALGPLLEVPGVFVFGSNDYFAPRLRNPARYLITHKAEIRDVEDLPWGDLRDGFLDAGWLDLTNARGTTKAGARTVAFGGVDDPHLRRDRYEIIAGPADPTADLAIGVTHAPYLRTLDAFTRDGYPLVLAGHTHGGQLCIPGYGALVTNCDLDTRRVKGVHRHAAGGRTAWIHVSAGLGTSPYAPVRFACPPEASLLTLVAR
jgi:uncharacterized protein